MVCPILLGALNVNSLMDQPGGKGDPLYPPSVVDRANGSSTEGGGVKNCQNASSTTGVYNKPWFLMQNARDKNSVINRREGCQKRVINRGSDNDKGEVHNF